MPEKNHRPLTAEQIKTLQQQFCTAEDWGKIKVADGFDARRVRNTAFLGPVFIGSLSGSVKTAQGLEKSAGIYNSTISNCSIADNVRISNVSVHIASYDIGPGVCIEDVATMQTNPAASFGNGIEVEVINEAGGREVILFNELSSQFAYLSCLHRYREKLMEKLAAIAKNYAQSICCDRGTVGRGARICSTTEIIDVNVGPYAVVKGACSVTNGTILSSQQAPATVGAGVIAKDFIIAEGACVTSGAILEKVFVGQGCQIGKQFSAENCLFFANCEAFHGEACAVFAGPYTVTHHKSTLLIAGIFSFYNAGSGTNQSNHMYKLGPVHEGKFERGTKTGSFSYTMWPCRTGPFSVVLGKHSGNFDTSDFAFSLIQAAADGTSYMIPGLNITTVGTVRDGAKWPSRDRRKGKIKRDRICFDVFSPYTVGKMIKATAVLKNLQQTTDKSTEEVNVGGTRVKRPILRTGQKFYRAGIEMYLLEKVFDKAEKNLQAGTKNIADAFKTDADAVYSPCWVDIAGQLCPQRRLFDLWEAIENGRISTIEAFDAELDRIENTREMDEWIWVKHTYKDYFGCDIEEALKNDIINAAESFMKAKVRFLKLVIADAEKEFGELSRTAFGQDGDDDIEKDFLKIRGRFEENEFVKQMQDDVEILQSRVKDFIGRIKNM